MFVINEKRWKVIGRFRDAFNFHLQVSPHLRAWTEVNSVCVSAADRTATLLTTSNTGCNRSVALDKLEFFKSANDVDRLLHLLPHLEFMRDGLDPEDRTYIGMDGAYARVYRVRGTNYLAVSTGCSDCDE